MAMDKDEAIEFLRIANDASSDNVARGQAALRFRYGEQWPAYAVASRGLDRPKITINETNVYIKKICNQQRQQRPRGKASPVDNLADPKIAKVITGLGRHVEVNSDADNAYDTAFDFAATIGWGYWRVRADYIREDSFDQDIFLDMIHNPFSVRFDPNSVLPDGSDAESALITTFIPIAKFKREYPGAEASNFDNLTANSKPDWVTANDINVAEFMKVSREKAKLIMLSNGKAMWDDDVKKLYESGLLAAHGLTVARERQSFKRVVRWCKQTGAEILEETDLPGRWIPIVPVYWTRVHIDGKDVIRGMVEDMMDPAKLNNFWQSAITETLGQAIKPKYILAEGQDEGHELEWKNANMSNTAVLRYKQTDVNGQMAPPPQRIQPEPPPAGFIEAAFLANQNLSRVAGVFDPAVRGGAQHKSDKTLNAEAGQSEMTNYDGYDNLVRSIKHSWRIMLSYIPVVYDTKRVARIIGEDGREEMTTLNEPKQMQDQTGQAIQKVLNDVTVGTYDVVMETGPGYATQRKEGVAAMLELMATPLGEKVAQVGDDLLVREMDFPGSDVLADRLAAANPLSQIDEKLEIPPQVQMKLKQQDAVIQQLQQQLQAAAQEIKLRGGIQQMKEEAATKRTLITATTKAHDIERRTEATQQDVAMRVHQDANESALDYKKAMDVEEIRGHIALLLAKIDEASEKRAATEASEHAVQ